ncbi:MAG: carbohydrate-binding domain-containing protein [Lachnospiraceae bacterium]|nr:carbohydrate-binding domain-containing protein [Lachnospiraceae bacterium]
MKKKFTLLLIPALILALLLSACRKTDDTSTKATEETTVQDPGQASSETPNDNMPTPPNGQVPDGSMPTPPDGQVPDGSMPTPPDGQIPDGSMPTPPDGEFPGGQRPDDGQFPGGQQPGGQFPGGQQGSASPEDLETVASFTKDDEFSSRDLKQEADLAEAIVLTVTDGQNLTIDAASVYVLSGKASEVTVYVEAGDEDKVQLVLDGLEITNEDTPCIYVKSADKVFVTTVAGSDNTLTVTGDFATDDGKKMNAVIFSKDDLCLNGLGTLNISSSDNGIVSKDDLKVTGGTLAVTAENTGLKANDSIRISDGDITVRAKNDGLHAEYDEDDTVGYIYIAGGSLDIEAADDGIHATTILQVDAGTINVTALEGLEATFVRLNGGTITVNATDDGINAAQKSTAYTPAVIFAGADVTITMGRGDTDAVDSNGSILVSGGTITITAQSAFDYDTAAWHTGGTIIVNGQEIDEIPNQFGPGGMGGHGGFPGGQGGQGGWGGNRP